MSSVHSRLGLAVCVAALFLAEAAWAQRPSGGDRDLLDQVRRMEKVAAQKFEADLRQTLREAERLARSDRAKAVERLKKALALLEDDTLLSPERRESLKQMLRDRLRVTESDTDDVGAGSGGKNRPPPIRSAQSSRASDQEKTRAGLKTIEQLQTDGKTEAANREAGALVRQQPQNSAASASEQMTRAADQFAKARTLQKDHERQLASRYRDVDKSATPSGGDMEYPKDWKERTKGRTASMPLTSKEQAILQALNTTISVNFRNSKLEDVIEYLQTYMGQPILLDREGMKDAEISYDTAVTLNVKGVTVRTILRKILGELGMTYVVKDETIQATSAQRARETLVVRRYYVGDLLAGMGFMGTLGVPQPGWGNPGVLPGGVPNYGVLAPAPAVNAQLQGMQNLERVKQLTELIQTSAEPQTWQANGGNGTIVFHAPSMSFIIKQSAEVHALLGSGGLLR